MKKLICEKSITDIIAQGGKTVCVDDNTLITPAARDRIRAEGLEIVGEGCTCASTASAPAAAAGGDALDSEMIYNALKKMSDGGMLGDFFEKNAAEPACAADAPYKAECDKGFKLVRGGGIKMDVFETGVPADNGKVQYQELIGSYDGSSTNAGFMTVDKCTFDWDVEPEETYFVVEGEMTVTIDGVPHTAYPGDCLFIQKGSKVVFSSGNTKAKVFYVTY